MKYVVDTHSLVWYFTKDKRLSNRVKSILQESEDGRNELIIPTIVLLEAVDICEKKKISFDIDKLFSFIEAKDNFQISDVDFPLVKELVRIGRGLDLHDRIILATGKLFNGIILTRDSKLKKFTKVIW
ncbi:MAG: PIN domain-containing protein [Patescibacteria group bacterium]